MFKGLHTVSKGFEKSFNSVYHAKVRCPVCPATARILSRGAIDLHPFGYPCWQRFAISAW